MSEKDGGPAFPRPYTVYHSAQDGMSLRDYFAAAYITGRAAREDGIDTFAEAAGNAYLMADRMLKARAK